MSKQPFTNAVFSIATGNVDLHFVIHHESFSQSRERALKGLHSHVYYEILYSLEGCNTLFLKDGACPIGKSCFAVVPPYHQHRASFENSDDLFSIGFFYEKRQDDSEGDDYASLLDKCFSKACITGTLDDAFRSLFLRLRERYRQSTPVANGEMLGLLLQIVFGILESLEREAEMGNSLQEEPAMQLGKPYSPRGISFDVLYRINEALNASYTEDITPELLSEQFFISPKQINRYIFKQYGQTFLQRRTELRMTAAQKLLAETDQSISDICVAVGYHSINTFYSAFKTFCHQTPDAYRKSRRAEI